MPAFDLIVNGKSQRVSAAADTPLLWVLRDSLGLTGTKYGCGAGACGACTVHVGGVPERSCLIAVSDVSGRAITTIEGLAPASLHAIQRAWIAEDVAQCGYCQPALLLAAAALLREHREPDDATIDDALAGHVCRCGTWPRVRRAIARAAREGAR